MSDIRIKSIYLENFKGAESVSHTFDGKNATITGCNGAGKTTIADSYFWALADKNYALASNPNVRPIGEENRAPSVEIVFDIDGREVTVFKKQKFAVKKSKIGGADTFSTSNTYAVNFAECGKKELGKKMWAYGFDFELFLALSHPDVFTGQKSVDMRKILFGMSSEKSDKEIAKLTDGAEDVDELLSDYTVDEVKSMQNSALRKIREAYGKDGEILRAEIRGKESSKTDIDVKSLESAKKYLDAQIAENRAKQEDISKELKDRESASVEIYQLKRKIDEIKKSEESAWMKKQEDIQLKIGSLKYSKREEYLQIQRNEQSIFRAEDFIKRTKEMMEELVRDWTDINERIEEEQKREFNENNLVCEYCGQELPADKKQEQKAMFEEAKEKKLNELRNRIELINKKGTEAKRLIKESEEQIKRLNEDLKKSREKETELEKEIKEAEQELADLPESIDISDREDVKEIKQQISEKEASLNQGNGADEIRQRLKSDWEKLQKQMDAINQEFALLKRNEELDADIAGLRVKQRQYEQEKADAERILYQLDLISRKKNELLTDEINRNFDIVRWQFFIYQKNGEYKECCIPLIYGKTFGESTNTGLEILAKLDIIKNLQRFYGQSYPVFLDNAECLSEETKKRIEMDCQIIYLSVSEDKELRIEAE